MKLPFRILCAVFAGLFLQQAAAQHITIRLSIKIIVDPVSGLPPAGISNGLFQVAVARANQWMADYWRGYRFQITELTTIGGPAQGGVNGPSKWFNVPPVGTNMMNQKLADLFQEDTRTNGLYLRRTNQVNFYVNTAPAANTGGWCPIAPAEASNLSCWGIVNDGPFWVVHETGHYFGLVHTFGDCQCSAGCSYPDTGSDDGISDTLPEGDCWTLNQIAVANFNGTNYANLTPDAKRRVDDTFYNVMSYHNVPNKDVDESRMTELQLDRHANTANASRNAFVSGRTRYVSTSGDNGNSGLTGGAPKRTVLNAVAASASGGGDIVLLRPGNYNEQVTLMQPVTLRATRAGWVTIGRP